MNIKLIQDLRDISDIAPDDVGRKIMTDKSRMMFFRIENLNRVAVQILKQEALSFGAELVTPREAILGKKKAYNCILFGSKKSIKLLAKKLSMQPFGLKSMANDINRFMNIKDSKDKKLMAIVNINSDSFHTEFKDDHSAIEHIYSLLESKVDIIDIGAVSSRPGSVIVDSDTELERLRGIFNEIRNLEGCFSIDTYNEKVACKAVDCGFSIINDISGKAENMVGLLTANKHVSYVLTHIKGDPSNMQDQCCYEDLILDIDAFFQDKLELLHGNGITNVILDVGIGFAKNTQQNINLIENLDHFNRFGRPLLIGISNKSVIRNTISNDDIDINEMNLRDASLVAGIIALKNGASILRVHSIDEYKSALSICKALRYL